MKLLVFGIVWLGAFSELLFDPSLREILFRFLLEHSIWAPFVLAVAQMLFASLALPCSPLTVLAGLLWGFETGLLYSVLATLLGSLWTFVLGRHALKKRLSMDSMPKWSQGVMKLIERYDWKASMIAHANPVFPGSSLGYAFGVSSVSMRSFALGALLGTLPLQILMVGVGHLVRNSLGDGPSMWIITWMAIMILAVLAYWKFAPILLSRTTK